MRQWPPRNGTDAREFRLQNVSDPDAVAALYGEHHGWLQGWLRRKLGCGHSAADLAQDTFLRLLLKSDRAPLAAPRAYLATVAHGLVVDHLRRRDLERAYLDELARLPRAMQPSEEERAVVLEALQGIARLLDGLTPKVRAAFLHSRVDGLAHAEIAALLGVSVPRVRQYLAAAVRHCYTLRYGMAA